MKTTTQILEELKKNIRLYMSIKKYWKDQAMLYEKYNQKKAMRSCTEASHEWEVKEMQAITLYAWIKGIYTSEAYNEIKEESK